MKKVLIINGHPDSDSFCHQLADNYRMGAEKAGYICNMVQVSALDFDPVLRYGYRKRTELEPDLVKLQQDILDCNHLVVVYPVWWGTYPALLKGLFDRVFLPGFAFKYRDNSLLWDKLLKGRTASLLLTMDTPLWYYRLVFGSPGIKAVKNCLLEFCGIKPVFVHPFCMMKIATPEKRQKWLKKTYNAGTKLK